MPVNQSAKQAHGPGKRPQVGLLHPFLRSLILLAAFLWPSQARAEVSLRLLDSRLYHLRNAPEPEWQEFAARQPDGSRLDLHFTAASNATENTLLIRQDNVKFEWTVQLNGRKIGVLEP